MEVRPISYVCRMLISTKAETERIRLPDIDFLRSLAIVIMIYANSFPYAADFEPPGILRILMSLAAPLFIFLSGFTSTLEHSQPKTNITTAGALVLSACFIDIVIWEIIPLYTFDVLYCIAATLFFNGIVRYTHQRQIALIVFTLISYSALHYAFPYSNEITELTLDEADSINIPIAIQQATITGWFPLFPWMAFGFLGRLYGKNLDKIDPILHKFRSTLLICLPLAVLMGYRDSQIPMRMGYIEVFYPPSVFYLLLAFLWIAVLLSYKNRITKLKPSNFFLTLGKSSLLIYMIHAAVNHHFIEPKNIRLNFAGYSILIALLLLLFHFIATLHQLFKQHKYYRSCPIIIRKIFGI
jgi:uncharacterized membrane protein